jgi:alpha-glucosidase
VIPTLSPQINAAPSLTPTIYDAAAPNPQDCPGYTASNVAKTSQGFTADLTISGPNCQAFGNDIAELILEVNYQTTDRLNVKIYPQYLGESNRTRYILPSEIVPSPENDGCTSEHTSNLKFEWSNEPSFQFRVLRTSSEEELFSTYGRVIVFEDQFLELATDVVEVSVGLSQEISGSS